MNMWRVKVEKFVHCEFNADLKNVIMSRGIIASFFLDEEIAISIINEIKTIVSEGVTNAIIHGYKDMENDNNIVSLKLHQVDNKLYITIEDKGVGIEDIEKAKEPLFSTSSEKERAGLGMTIMEMFSDSMEIKSKVGSGTCLLLVKKLY